MSDDSDKCDFDKREWQAQQAARDVALEKRRDKDRKMRERSARYAKRKLERLQTKLKETGELSQWEDEFSASVTERLDKYGSAFLDGEKGRSGEALSFAQKRIVASLTAKVKNKDRKPPQFKNNGFRSKTDNGFTPRVRHIEDDMPIPDDPNCEGHKTEAVYSPENAPESPARPKKPFLRLVKSSKP